MKKMDINAIPLVQQNEVLNERIIPLDIASSQSDVKLEKKPSVSNFAEESDVVWS
jgi:hypothetical protein